MLRITNRFGEIDREQAKGLGCDVLNGDEWIEQEVDILLPAALENQINVETAPKINDSVKVIVEGANGPTTPEADEIIKKKNIWMIPDFLANAGGVTCSYFEQVQCNMNYFWTKEEVLKKLDVPDNVVTGQIAALRSGRYGILRALPTDNEMLDELAKFLQTTATRTHYLAKNSDACGTTIADLDLRAQSGVTIIAVVRNGNPTANPPADFELAAGDVLVLVGSHQQLDDAESLLAP